jgi:hypothetical protein
VRLVLGSLICFALAAAIGLGLTWVSVSGSFTTGGLTIGAWTARPKSGTVDIDPYSRAVVERNGTLPIGIGDGVTFIARTDDAGHPLDGRCDVVLNGTTPQARFFTVTLYSPDGKLISNVLKRSGFTSQELIRNGDGSFRISIGPRARPGNWLPTGGVEHYSIFLRLYDTPVGIQTRAGRETPMPSVVLGECR